MVRDPTLSHLHATKTQNENVMRWAKDVELSQLDHEGEYLNMSKSSKGNCTLLGHCLEILLGEFCHCEGKKQNWVSLDTPAIPLGLVPQSLALQTYTFSKTFSMHKTLARQILMACQHSLIIFFIYNFSLHLLSKLRE